MELCCFKLKINTSRKSVNDRRQGNEEVLNWSATGQYLFHRVCSRVIDPRDSTVRGSTMPSLRSALDRHCGLPSHLATDNATVISADCLSPTAPVSPPIEFRIRYWSLSPFFAQLGAVASNAGTTLTLTFPKHMLPYLLTDTLKDGVVATMQQAYDCNLQRRDLLLRCFACQQQHRFDATLESVCHHAREATVVHLSCHLSEQGHLRHRSWLL